MKKLLLTAAAILATLNMYAQGQGTLSFTSVGAGTPPAGGPQKLITDPTGAPAGAGYAVALYWGDASQTTDASLTQIGASANMLTGNSAGTFFGGGRTITTPGSAINGPVLTFQVRGWATAAGNSYDAARAAGGATGKGAIFTLKTKDPTDPLTTAPNLWQAPGYLGFQIAVPEPSTIALGLIGGVSALLMLRRRK